MPNNEDTDPHICIICGRQANWTNDDGDFCDQCHSILYFECNHCHEWFRATNRHSLNRGDFNVCDHCYDELGQECPQCGNAFTMDHLHRFRGRLCCDSCISDLRRSRSGVGNYHSHGYQVPNDDKLRLGFELETGDTCEDDMMSCVDELRPIGGYNDDDDEYDEDECAQDLFYLEHDGSIPEYGFELISTPHTLDEYKNDIQTWTNILALLKKWGLHSPSSCGLHIHASKRFMDSYGWNLVGWFVNSNRAAFESLARRGGNNYARYYDYDSYRKFCRNIEYDMDRYSAVNYHSSQHTIEFRMFASTTNINTLYEDLELIDALVRWVKDIHDTDNDMLIIERPQEAFKTFKEYVKNNNYDKAVALIERKGV